MAEPRIVSAEYAHEAMLYYATPESGYHDSHFIELDAPNPAEVNNRVHSAGARSRLAFFHITRRALVTVDHGDVSDVQNMSNVHYGAGDGFERIYGSRLMTATHFVVGESDHTFDLMTEAEIVESNEVPERVQGWLRTWREGNYMSNFFPEIQQLL